MSRPLSDPKEAVLDPSLFASFLTLAQYDAFVAALPANRPTFVQNASQAAIVSASTGPLPNPPAPVAGPIAVVSPGSGTTTVTPVATSTVTTKGPAPRPLTVENPTTGVVTPVWTTEYVDTVPSAWTEWSRGVGADPTTLAYGLIAFGLALVLLRQT